MSSSWAPELLHIQALFRGLAQELTSHMMKEEMVLFPYIERMEESVIQAEPLLPPPFATVSNPVAMMEHEHDAAGNALRAMRKASNDYVAPESACASYQGLYRAFVEFEADLHQHIHVENNILFSRAIKMERGSKELEDAKRKQIPSCGRNDSSVGAMVRD